MANTPPRFEDGDIEVRLSSSPRDTLVLHSHALILHSRWFNASLGRRWNAQNGLADPPFRVYELRFEKESAIGLLSRLGNDTTDESTELHVRSSHHVSHVASEEEQGLSARRLGYIEAHRMLFNALYFDMHDFRTSPFIESLEQIRLLAEVSNAYGASHIVRGHIEMYMSLHKHVHSVLKFDCGILFEIALALRSHAIFEIAAIAVTESDSVVFATQRPRLSELNVINLVLRTRAVRSEQLRACERTISQMLNKLYPSDHRPRLAERVFDQWLREQVAAQKGSAMGPRYYDLHQNISSLAKGDVLPWNRTSFTTILHTFRPDVSYDTMRQRFHELAMDATEIIKKSQVSFHMEVRIDESDLPWVRYCSHAT
ncbi:unnamed protein product [Zymoseptoria tritici ST99CH_3D1]|nr:unnamed protein product [Zymoseptoria tritici ST99CH_3D1]